MSGINMSAISMSTIKKRLLVLLFIVFGAASASPAAGQIVALGASNTQGKGVSPSEAWPAVLESMLHARGRSSHVVNAGISGDTTGGMLARLDSSVPEGTTLVILNFGGNDFSRGRRGGGLISPEARQGNIVKILAELHRRRTIEADGIINSARAAGMVQIDGDGSGHRRVAS